MAKQLFNVQTSKGSSPVRAYTHAQAKKMAGGSAKKVTQIKR